MTANGNPRGAIRNFANFNASSNDITNPSGEWVSLWNTSGTAIFIGGYKLESDGKIYTFADGTMLNADQNMRVKVSTGTNTATEIYWGNTSGIVSNTAGDATLQTNYRQTADTFVWS